MLDVKPTVVLAPAISDIVFQFQNNGDLPPYCVVENLDALASAPIFYMESDNGSNWSPIQGTNATVNPGQSNGQVVTSSKSRIALNAGGNVKLLASIIRQVNGTPQNLGAA